MSQLNLPANVLVRRAVADEAAIIARVLYQSFLEFEAQYTPAAFTATTPTSDEIHKRWQEGPVWVVEQGDQIVGTISAVPKSEGLYIRSMVVLPSARGHGIGYALLQTIEQFAIAQAFQRMFLSTTPFLAGAIQLYGRFGFYQSNDPPHDLFETPLFTMIKRLETAGSTSSN